MENLCHNKKVLVAMIMRIQSLAVHKLSIQYKQGQNKTFWMALQTSICIPHLIASPKVLHVHVCYLLD